MRRDGCPLCIVAVSIFGVLSLARAQDETTWPQELDIKRAMRIQNDEARVRSYLFDGADSYDPDVRPVLNASIPVSVEVGLALKKVLDVDITAGVATVSVWLRASWLDPRLEWNSSAYGGRDRITVRVDEVWTPDFIVYDTVEKFEENVRHEETRLYLYPSGIVYWSRPAVLKVSFDQDVLTSARYGYFPYDKQTIKLSIIAWSYSGLLQDLVVLDYYVNDAGGAPKKITNGTMDFIDVTSAEFRISTKAAKREIRYYACCPGEPWPMVTFYVELERKARHYVLTIIVPTVLTTYVSFTTFLLPHACGERLSLGITCVLVIFTSLYVSSDVIPTSDRFSVLGLLYLTCFLYTLLALCATVAARCLRSESSSDSYQDGSFSIPSGPSWILRDLVLGFSPEAMKAWSIRIDKYSIVLPYTFTILVFALLTPWLSAEAKVSMIIGFLTLSALMHFLAHKRKRSINKGRLQHARTSHSAATSRRTSNNSSQSGISGIAAIPGSTPTPGPPETPVMSV